MTDADRRARLEEIRDFHRRTELHLEDDGRQVCGCGNCEARLLLTELERVEARVAELEGAGGGGNAHMRPPVVIDLGPKKKPAP